MRFEPPSGPVEGWVDRDVVRVSGVPYATAARFAPPQPAPDRTEVLPATSWSPACPQRPSALLDEVLGMSSSEMPVDEHCQNLTLTLPRDIRPEESLPVMVWIHGGSYVVGAGDVPVMDPRPLVAEQRVIVVTVTYRLGMFGFLGGQGRPANLGLLDQIEALRWVQRNIAAFGGDPRNVTAFGQSAGGDAVAHIMATPDAASLFTRAIIQSAPLGISRGRARMSRAMAAAAPELTAEMPVDQIVAGQEAVERAARGFGLLSGMPFGTQYGQAPLPAERRVDAAWRRGAPEIEVLIGHTAEEARMFVPALPVLRRRAARPLIRPLVALTTWLVYGRGMRRFARRHARAGGRVHRYIIDWGAPGSGFGAAHTIDLPLLFGDEATWAGVPLVAGSTWNELDDAGRAVRRVWADFARGMRADRPGVDGVIRIRGG